MLVTEAFSRWLGRNERSEGKSRCKTLNGRPAYEINTASARLPRPHCSRLPETSPGSTFGHSSASEKKARLEAWRGSDPIKVSGGTCTTTAKGVGHAEISEAGRKLLANGLQRLLAAEQSNGLITRVFRASRNLERDAAPEVWAAEFIRKASTIINASCGQ